VNSNQRERDHEINVYKEWTIVCCKEGSKTIAFRTIISRKNLLHGQEFLSRLSLFFALRYDFCFPFYPAYFLAVTENTRTFSCFTKLKRYVTFSVTIKNILSKVISIVAVPKYYLTQSLNSNWNGKMFLKFISRFTNPVRQFKPQYEGCLDVCDEYEQPSRRARCTNEFSIRLRHLNHFLKCNFLFVANTTIYVSNNFSIKSFFCNILLVISYKR